MIDLHLHLLPGVDDGATSLPEAELMLARAKAAGFRTLVATPHLNGTLSQAYQTAVEAAHALVYPEATRLGLTIERGYEIQLSPDLPRRLAAGEPLTLAGGPTVLVELPFVGWPIFTEHVLFDVQAAGFRPLLAHPERYAEIQSDVSRALTLVELGISLQVTIGSLVGLFGKRAQRVAEELLRQDAVAALATDAHSAGQRIETVNQGLERARDIVGPDRLRQLIIDNPAAMLRGEPLPPAEPIRPTLDPGGGWFGSLRRTGRRRRRRMAPTIPSGH